MNNLSEYILEKLHLNKNIDMSISKEELNSLAEKITINIGGDPKGQKHIVKAIKKWLVKYDIHNVSYYMNKKRKNFLLNNQRINPNLISDFTIDDDEVKKLISQNVEKMEDSPFSYNENTLFQGNEDYGYDVIKKEY